MSRTWWDDPDWYDLHDHTAVAGVEKEPEHYRELVLALPPLGPQDHLVDVGAGTGKLAHLVAAASPMLGRLTLLEPNEAKLARARARLGALLGEERVRAVPGVLGEGALPRLEPAGVVTVGSVFMPVLLSRGGSLRDGLAWLERALGEVRGLLAPGGALWSLETLAMPWDLGPASGPVRRLGLVEYQHLLAHAGFAEVECVYRFRDRVALRAVRG